MVLAAGVVLSACGGGGTGADPASEAGDAGSPTGGAAAGQGSAPTYVERLSLLPPPDRSAVVQVTMGDPARAAELAGVEVPRTGGAGDPGATAAALGQLYGAPGSAVFLAAPELSGGQSALARQDEVAAELGWGLADLDWFAELSTPPRPAMVAGGDVTASDLTGAAGDPTDGVWQVGEGDALAFDPGAVTAARPVGAPLFMAVGGEEGPVAGAFAVAAVPEALRAVSGAGATAAEDAGLLALATLADVEGCYGVVIALGSGAGAAAADQMVCQRPDLSSGAAVLVVGLLPGEAAATAEVDRVQDVIDAGTTAGGQPLSSLLTDTAVAQEGRAVLLQAVVAGERSADTAVQALLRREQVLPGG